MTIFWHTLSKITLLHYAVTMAIVLPSSVSLAGESTANWPTECVGRLQIAIPGQVDVASLPYEELMAGDPNPTYRFDDGQIAGYSEIQYNGLLFITRELQTTELEAVQKEFSRRFETVKKRSATQQLAEGKTSPQFLRLHMSRLGLAWQKGDDFHAFISVERHAVHWAVHGHPETRDKLNKIFRIIADGLQFRPLLSVPSGNGVCIPYGFINDDGVNSRKVAATYRLRDHPDVTIMLEDARARDVASFQDPEKFTAIYKSNFFWTQRYRSVKSRENLLHGSYHKIKFAGQSAVETMFKLTRDDNTEDFGYLVVTRGDPDAKEDTPDLMMYVIQNAQHAVMKGIKPMEKEKFFEMAKAISASVKRREIR